MNWKEFGNKDWFSETIYSLVGIILFTPMDCNELIIIWGLVVFRIALYLTGEKYDLKYIIANQKKGLYYPFTDELFYNYNQYPYLKKIFDSDEFGFKKLKIKVFEINYEKFHE